MEKNILDTVDLIELGNALSTARSRRGLTQAQAAEVIGVARTTMVAIEKGERRIKPSELIQLADVYGRQISDFITPQADFEPFQVQFRGPLPYERTEEDNEKIAPCIDKLEDLARKFVRLEELTESEPIRKYPPEYKISGQKINYAAENVAVQERNRLGLGDAPIQILRDILEQDVGLRIFYLALPAEYSEIYFYNDTLGGCIAINKLHPEERCRWSLAHAYGHFLAHRYKPSMLLINQRIPESERFADRFATFFLMPSSSLQRKYYDFLGEREKPTQADLLMLASYYGVSFEAITIRLEDVKLIPAGSNQKLKRRGVKVREAQKELGLTSVKEPDHKLPRRHQYLAVQAFEEELITWAELAEYLDIDMVHARRIANLLSDSSLDELAGD